MGHYVISATDETLNILKSLEIPKPVKLNDLLNMLFVLKHHNVLKYIPDSSYFEDHYGDGGVFNSRPKLEDLYTRSYGRSSRAHEPLIAQLMATLSHIDITEFDLTDYPFKAKSIDNMDTRIKIYSVMTDVVEYKRPITINGHFFLRDPIPQKYHKVCSKITFTGDFVLDNSLSLKSIELPEKLNIPPFPAIDVQHKVVNYKSVEDYRNRPERLSRLAKNREIRERIKQANEAKVLLFTDSKCMPLDVGSIVVFSISGSPELGEVLRQTNKKIIVRDFSNGVEHRLTSYEVLRIG